MAINLYNAFTSISPVEKKAVVKFLCQYTSNANQEHIKEAVEYAVKQKPSFGGFIITAVEDQKIIATIVANKTGMEGYNANNIFVYFTLHETHRDNDALVQKLMSRAMQYADGDVAMHVEPDNPALKLYKKLGFVAQYLELRLSKSKVAVA